MTIRNARADDMNALATIWHLSWHDAHALLLPEALVRLRTPQSFRDRTAEHLSDMRVIEIFGQPLGFCYLTRDELDQFYIAAEARGTGAADKLIADAEDGLRRAGHETAWLACAIGNMRAARFYEKSGWRRNGTMTFNAEIPSGTLPLEAWRYEKLLTVKC
jgi:GNAT superfamily N-acetyltransferase